MMAAPAPISWAAGDLTKTEEADQLRKSSRDKAKRKLAYPDVYDVLVGPSGQEVDFYALSRQIERLAAIVRAFGQSVKGTVPPPIPGVSGTGGSGEIKSFYGPDGPTAKSVRLILEYRLMVAGNPRLAVGPVEEDSNRVIARIVTLDGSPVEEYQIDKKTGAWIPVR